MNWWENIVVHSAPAIIQGAVRKDSVRAQLRHVLLDIYTVIKEAYSGDSDFK